MTSPGFVCATCGTRVAIDAVHPWRCPRESGDRHHVLLLVSDASVAPAIDDENPFVRFGPRMAWWAFARSRGFSEEQCVSLVREVDQRLIDSTGRGFRVSPLVEQPALATLVGSPARVWVKDETHNVGGSQKARHLMSILLHLLVSERTGGAPWSPPERPSLAISSCGNAAIAAATLARAMDWPIEVFIPEWAGGSVVATLESLGARIERCPRRAQDPPGDPTVLRFREAVSAGSVPFSVQGPENALCLDGGRTIGWESAEQLRASGVESLSGLYVQVGGGAFAASFSRGLGEGGVDAPLIAVQTEGCAPLSSAWRTCRATRGYAAEWTRHMAPWPEEPRSLADGILDDETYDWVADVDEMNRTGGRVVVAPESAVVEAAEVGPRLAGIDASPTATAGLAGLLVEGRLGAITGDVLLAFSGVRR